MSTLAVVLVALAFLFVMFVRWASQSIPRAIIFVALLCASPFALMIGIAVLTMVAENQQHHTVSAKR